MLKRKGKASRGGGRSLDAIPICKETAHRLFREGEVNTILLTGEKKGENIFSFPGGNQTVGVAYN